jgi:hypothetical protein
MKAPLFAAAAAVLSLLAPATAAPEYQIRGLSMNPGLPLTELHAHNAEGTARAGVIQLKSFLNHEADTLEVKGPKLVFTAKADPASALDPAEVIGRCELPAKPGTVILLFLPEVADKPACKVLVVDDSKTAFPPGSILVVNSSTLPVKIELEKQPFEFKAGAMKLITDMPVGESNTAGMKGYCERDGKWQVFSSGIWPHPGEKRVLQVLTDNASGLVDIRGVRDVATP